jgi:hypothetical protein
MAWMIEEIPEGKLKESPLDWRRQHSHAQGHGAATTLAQEEIRQSLAALQL